MTEARTRKPKSPKTKWMDQNNFSWTTVDVCSPPPEEIERRLPPQRAALYRRCLHVLRATYPTITTTPTFYPGEHDFTYQGIGGENPLDLGSKPLLTPTVPSSAFDTGRKAWNCCILAALDACRCVAKKVTRFALAVVTATEQGLSGPSTRTTPSATSFYAGEKLLNGVTGREIIIGRVANLKNDWLNCAAKLYFDAYDISVYSCTCS